MPTWSSSPTAHPSIEKCRLLRYFGSSLRVGQHYLDFSTYVESRVSFDSTAWNRYCSTSVEIYLKWQTSKRKLEIPAIIIIPLLCSLRLKIWTFPGKSKCGRKEGSWWGWCGVYVVWTGGTSHHTGLGQAIIPCASTWRRTSPKSPLSGLALTCVCTVYNMYAVIVSFNVKLCSVEHIAKRFGGTWCLITVDQNVITPIKDFWLLNCSYRK